MKMSIGSEELNYSEQVKALHVKSGVHYSPCGDETQFQHVHVVFPRPLNKQEHLAADLSLRDAFTMHCSCERDCCGHYHGGLRRIKWINRREAFVRTEYSPNI